jgi:Ca-activated chloride channel family protein
MRHLSKYRVTAVAVVAATFAAAVQAQESTSPTFRSDARLVVLHASVADKNGRLLTNLGRDAFRVFENGVEQPIKLFKREDVPVSMALVVDNSGSMRNKRASVEAAAMASVRASNNRDEVAVVNFSDEAYHDVPFTSDIRKMEQGLTRLDSRGGTAMRDAISETIDYVRSQAKHDKKVLFVITDGNDTASLITLEKLMEKAYRSEVLLYFIGLLNDEDRGEAKKAKRAIEALAKASGGSALYPEDLSQVSQSALSIAQEIRNQYVIAYTPSNQALDGGFRSVRVQARGPSRPIVRTRTGYYATPDQGSKTQARANGN